jgi:hypothetical protein
MEMESQVRVEQTLFGKNCRRMEVCKDEKYPERFYKVLSGNGEILGIYNKLQSALDHLRSRI